MAQYTPMIQQYLAIKQEYPDTFLFFRLGDFYELFFEDAVLASRELEITLTGRDGGAEERIPMCGVPYHSADAYIAQLIQKGYKVAVCEQVEDPKAAKGVVRREVTRVITPGTLMEGQWLSDKENNYMVSIAESDYEEAVAACDLSTGEMYVTSFPAGSGRAREEALQYRPREIVSTQPHAQSWGEGFTLTCVDKHEVNDLLVRQQYAMQADGLTPGMTHAVATLLTYIFRTQKRNAEHLRVLKRYEPAEYLQMDPYSRRNLELTETIRDKQKKGSLLWLLDRTETAMGGRMLRRWLERPLRQQAEIERRLDAVQTLKEDLLLRSDLRQLLHEVYDLERLCGRIAYGNANARDLVQLRRSLSVIPAIKERLLAALAPVLSDIAATMDECRDLWEQLEQALVDDPPVSVREGGLFRPGYNAELDRLQTASREGKHWIAQLEQTEREKTGIRSLKVGFNKVFGYYIEVSRANLSHVPLERYERKQTLANAERFVTPELKEKEALILEAEEKLVELEYQLFVQLRQEMARHIARLQELAEQVATIDVYQSFATVSEERGYIRPEIATDGVLYVKEGRHPVVEAVLDKEKYVSNDVHLNPKERQILLITGPNMAGKSTYMRQIALLVIMAQIGCFIPAKEAKLSLVDQIFTRIGAADDLVGGHSTFMVEMLETKNALQKATPHSLILLDEIGRGTSTYDGMALAQAIIEYIHDSLGAKTLFSTHYHELTRLEEERPRVVNVNARCEERDGKLLFLHKIEEGRADKSYGIHVAELAELPAAVIRRARQILAELERDGQSVRAEQLSLDDLFASPQLQMAAAERMDPEQEERVKRELIAELEKLDVYQLTPLAALNLLAEWKQRLERNAVK